MPWCCGKPPQGDAEGAECHGGREEARKANTGDSAATSALASLQLPRLLGDAELAHLKRLEQEGDRLLDMSLQEFKLYTRDKKRSMVLFERPVAGTQVSGKPDAPRRSLLLVQCCCRTHVALRPPFWSPLRCLACTHNLSGN